MCQVCNNLGQCHCDAGYAPPHCDRPGNGGSEHSGPIMVLHGQLSFSSCILSDGLCSLTLKLALKYGRSSKSGQNTAPTSFSDSAEFSRRLVPAYPGCPGKRPLNGCSSSKLTKYHIQLRPHLPVQIWLQLHLAKSNPVQSLFSVTAVS